MAFNILFGFFAVVHLGVLGVDFGKGKFEFLKKFLGCGILFDEFPVGNHADVINHKTGFQGIGDGSLDSGYGHAVLVLFLGSLGDDLGDIDPHDIFAGLEFIDCPVWRPGIEKYGFPTLVVAQCRGHACFIRGLDGVDVVF